jgi:serine phosphatase RsbU (regulator of sigma subunit)
MLDRSHSLAAPHSAQEETTYRLFSLKVIVLSALGLITVYELVDWAVVIFTPKPLNFGNFLWFSTFLLLIFDYWLVRRERVKAASFLSLAMVTVATALAMYNVGTKDTSMLLFAFGVSLAGILLGARGAILLTLLNTIIFAGLAYAENARFNVPPVPPTALLDVVALATILLALVAVEWLFRFERARLLYRYREQAAALRATNEALEQANQTLAQQEAWRHELELAREIQASLLPQHDPTLAGFDIKGRSLPAEEVGGDFYTYFPLSGGRLGLAIGDVSGKGMPSALYMAIATSAVEAQAAVSPDTVSLMRNVNNLLYPRMHETGMNTALLYALFDLTRRQLRVCNAGLIVPILYHDKTVCYLESHGLPLGVVTEGAYEELLVNLEPGDLLLLMSDGIVEAMNAQRELYGFSRLEAVLENCDAAMNAQAVLNCIFDSTFDFMEGTSPHDDMTLVVIQVGGRHYPSH